MWWATYLAQDSTQSQVIVKEFDALTPDELRKHADEVGKQCHKEISDLHSLGCFKRCPRSQAHNIVDTRWVIRWKLVDGVKIIKVRLTMRGFKDSAVALDTFAGTASRWAQRLVNSVAATEKDFVLFSLDVSKAFAKGMTFKELFELTGQPLREVQFVLQPKDIAHLRKIPGFENFDGNKEVLTMVKPIYGLKDAPRAWRKKLHAVLTEFGLTQAAADGQIYLWLFISKLPVRIHY